MKRRKLHILPLAVILLAGLCACLLANAEASQTPTYQVGDYVTFGTYPQTKSGTDKTPIEWLVLDNDGETALLISRYALDCQRYNTMSKSITWEQCTLRSWLNNEFYNRAFSEDEKWRIVKSDVGADRNPNYNTNPGSSTKDNVFLLSIAEAERYFVGNEARKCKATDYAIQQGTYSSNGTIWWWLRSPGSESDYAAYVYNSGSIDGYGSAVRNSYGAVRPCVRIQLNHEPNYVTFGTYPQTASGTDNTPIEWLILESDGETALLISRYALDCQPYNTQYTSVTWEKCTLRSWLNNTFYNRAFSASEKQSILKSDVSADKNPNYNTNPGNATKDNVFLLSIVEAKKYFASNEARMCAATDYAIKQGAYTNSSYKVDGKLACLWWLRSPGYSSSGATNVSLGGSVLDYGDLVDRGNIAVRPCVRVRLSTLSGNYKDGEEQVTKSNNQTIQTSACRVGDYVTFGTYPQTASGTDNTPIEWLVLENDGETALLISRYALDCQPYNAKSGAATWENCTLRSWLNDEFYKRAFSDEDRLSILENNVSADKNPDYNTSPGNATKDNIFLLSIIETEKYFAGDEARMCAATEYARRQGTAASDSYIVDGKEACWWWLRSPGARSECAADLYAGGSVISSGSDVSDNSDAVRPCVRVRLPKKPFTEGSYVTFGTYPQTTSGTDDTPIEWLVLENDGETALLISRYALDCQPYNTQYTSVTWEKCTLRSWLNNTFYNRAFSASEKQSILKSDVSADKNPWYATNPGNATKDNVFLLSIVEADKYFASDEARMCAATDYAIKQGAWRSDTYTVDGRGACWWWLRSPGNCSSYAARVSRDGSIRDYGYGVNGSDLAVRPCVRVRLSDIVQNEWESSKTKEQMYSVGNYVSFGTYPQTSSGTDDTPIEWLVLENDGETALLISRYALDSQPYNTEEKAITWEKCTLRGWLNNEFYNRAFSDEERRRIFTSDVSADKNPWYATNPGNATKDNVFLLSIVEADKYFASDEARMCVATDYAIKQGAWRSDTYTVDGRWACWWWLRSPGLNSSLAAFVIGGGSISDGGRSVIDSHLVVRPCVRVRLF